MTGAAVKREAPPTQGIRHIAPAGDLEVRQESENGTATFAGYVVRWGDEATIHDWLGTFTERFVKGAFLKTVAERGPQGNGAIKFFRQHGFETSTVAARFLQLFEDDTGLRFEVQTIDTVVGRDLAAEVRSGVVDTVSFGFDAIQEIWNADEEDRTVLEARLWEVSAVNWQAYPNSKIDSVRAFERLPAYMDNLLAELRAGKVISAANMNKLTEARELLNQVIDSASEATPEPSDDDSLDSDADRALTQELAMRELEVQL
jgi:HK97 family phage prohead protease